MDGFAKSKKKKSLISKLYNFIRKNILKSIKKAFGIRDTVREGQTTKHILLKDNYDSNHTFFVNESISGKYEIMLYVEKIN